MQVTDDGKKLPSSALQGYFQRDCCVSWMEPNGEDDASDTRCRRFADEVTLALVAQRIETGWLVVDVDAVVVATLGLFIGQGAGSGYVTVQFSRLETAWQDFGLKLNGDIVLVVKGIKAAQQIGMPWKAR